MTTLTEDRLAIEVLLMTYAEHVDAGRLDEAAALFEYASYRVERESAGEVVTVRGAAPVREFFAVTRLYPDGTPRTKHVITNVHIELDGGRASSRCYVTVFQQTDVLPLQVIAAGRYIDRFERAGAAWQFTDRLVTGFLFGDRSQHLLWSLDPPGEEISP